MEQESKKKKRKLYDVPLDKDIRYRGPLSYRHFKIFGWVCIIVSQFLVFVSLGSRFAPDVDILPGTLINVMTTMASMAIPFLLIANFSLILDTRDGYKNQLRINGLAAAGIIILFLFIYLRYIIGVVSVLMQENRAYTSAFINETIASDNSNGYPAFNLFIDLFLCTLFMFFLDHMPSRIFTGKKIYIFRAFSLLPVLYEVASLTLKYLAVEQVIIMPVALIPFLTTKPPIMFIVFIILAVFIKNRERIFCKNGRSRQEYKEFLKTNRNSLHFSIFTSVTLLIAGFVDVLLYVILRVLETEKGAGTAGIISSLNLGDSAILILMAPIVMLFSYTRKYKNGLVDILIPVCAVVLIIFLYLECGYQGIAAVVGSAG